VKKVLSLFILTVGLHLFVAAQEQGLQTILLLSLTFDDGNNPMVFDSAGPSGNFGSNDWVINNLYSGQPTYPNTPNEDSTLNELVINNAPTSNYLHVYDVNTFNGNGVGNDNWNPANASDRFCYTGASFCTLGMDSVKFSFDWICQGDSNAYGQVYYSNGNGVWTQIGKPKYYGQDKWGIEYIQDPRLNNQANIQIGFRWVNSANAGPTNTGFGIDDIFAIGSYNPNDPNTAVSITTDVLSLTGFPICQGGNIYVLFDLSAELCDGNYEIEMSNANGSFDNPYNLGIIQGYPTVPLGYYGPIPVPPTLIGNCFKVRIERTSPAPLLISDTSICFSIDSCYTPNSIFNVMSPVVTNDPDTTCIQSEIDVLFNSLGQYGSNNVYIAELSDSSGNFADSTFLGNLASSDSFPSIPPGDISGLIPPSVPPGCGYRIRVRSTNPPTVGILPGTYCLVHCDELTNNITDLHFCVASGPYAECDTINIAIDHWNQNANYDTCNNWTVELHKMSDFSFVGDLKIYHDSVGGNYTLCMPSTVDSLGIPPGSLQPGSYYMRIVSSCSSQPWNETGTVIRITIGAPSASAPTVSFPNGDSVVCAVSGSLAAVEVNPFNSPPSQYQWSSNLVNNGNAFIWPYQELLINLNEGVLQGQYVFYVQEINFGCYGPSSAPGILTILGKPNATISGPATVCIGDTAQYHVSFLTETYYSWTASPGVQVLNRSNVEATCIFDSLGTFDVSVYALNFCDSTTGTIKVKVTPPPYTVNAGPDTAVCTGDSVLIQANPSALTKEFLVQDTGKLAQQGGMFNIVAHDDLTIDSFAVMLKTRPQLLQAEIWGKPGSYLGFEQNQSAWTQLAVNYSNATQPNGKFTIISAEVGQFIPKGDTFAFYVTTTNNPVIDVLYSNGNNLQGNLFNSDGVIDFIQGTVLQYPFLNPLPAKGYVLNLEVFYSTTALYRYTWSSGDSTANFEVAPNQNQSYNVKVSVGGSCIVLDTMQIKVNPLPYVYAGPDTSLCPNVPYVMEDSTSNPVTLLWQPSTGLSSATDPRAVFNYNDSVTYVLMATDTNHCSNKSSVNILVPLRLSVGPDTTICDGNVDTLQATTTGVSVVWNPGLGLNDSLTINPIFNSNIGPGGQFTITATDRYGCKLSGTVTVNVEQCLSKIVAPSAFTPGFTGNGTGQPDDHFIVWGKNIKEYQVRIYNRWGEKVYDSGMLGELEENYSPPLWDGKYKGKLQDTGTFVYYVDATGSDGKSIQQKGNVTLVR